MRLLARLAFWGAVMLFGAGRTWSEQAIRDNYFLTSDGVRLHYLEAGAGERTLVFIPGWLMPAAVFEAQLAGLAREYRVLAFDPRSQGGSEVFRGAHDPARRTSDLHEFLTAAGVADFVLAGWSLGVLESLDYVARYRPPGMKGLILIDNSIGEGSPPKPRPARFFEDLADPKRRERYLTEFCAGLTGRTPPPQLARAVLESALRVPSAAAQELIRQPYPRSYWRDIIARQTVPILYAITPRLKQQGEALLGKKPKGLAEVVVFEDAGHALFVDAAERFNAETLAFARKAFRPSPDLAPR